MRKSRTPGSARGVPGNGHSYRNINEVGFCDKSVFVMNRSSSTQDIER